MTKAVPTLLAGLLATLTFAVTAQTAPAAPAPSVEQGRQKAAQCIGCHGIPGYQSSFPQVHRVPMISGQNARYIVAALNAYKKGERRHPTMRAISMSLTDQDMADLGAFYEQDGQQSASVKAVREAPVPSAATAALLTRGACMSCHGVDYNKTIDPAYPKLAGQHADYLLVALQSYKVEGNPHIGRANAIMSAQVRQYTARELKLMADYLATLPGDLKTVPQPRFR